MGCNFSMMGQSFSGNRNWKSFSKFIKFWDSLSLKNLLASGCTWISLSKIFQWSQTVWVETSYLGFKTYKVSLRVSRQIIRFISMEVVISHPEAQTPCKVSSRSSVRQYTPSPFVRKPFSVFIRVVHRMQWQFLRVLGVPGYFLHDRVILNLIWITINM